MSTECDKLRDQFFVCSFVSIHSFPIPIHADHQDQLFGLSCPLSFMIWRYMPLSLSVEVRAQYRDFWNEASSRVHDFELRSRQRAGCRPIKQHPMRIPMSHDIRARSNSLNCSTGSTSRMLCRNPPVPTTGSVPYG